MTSYLDTLREEEFHHLRVLIDDGDGQGRPSQRIEAVDVEEVVLVLEGLDQLFHAGAVAPLHQQNESFLLRCQDLKSCQQFFLLWMQENSENSFGVKLHSRWRVVTESNKK